jgi:hypothetical protein
MHGEHHVMRDVAHLDLVLACCRAMARRGARRRHVARFVREVQPDHFEAPGLSRLEVSVKQHALERGLGRA